MFLLLSIRFNLYCNSVLGYWFDLAFHFVAYMYKLAKVKVPDEESEPVTIEEKSKLKQYVVFTIIGALGVVLSANFLVESAINIATAVGIPQAVIGATIVAAGTSLPELTVSLKSPLRSLWLSIW